MIGDFYNYMMVQRGDPRLSNTFWYASPFPTLALTLIYLFTIYWWIPEAMKKREAYGLKGVLIGYNIFQIVCCFLLLLKFNDAGFTFDYLWNCIEPEYTVHPMSMKMLAGYTYACLIKRIELFETVFYALRKKTNQVSFLHVYHHISTLWFAWASCKYVSGGMITFSIVINTYVHLFMYMYYLLSAMGGSVQEKISVIKPVVTVIQLVQFLLITFNNLTALLTPTCNISKPFLLLYIPNIVFLIVLFSNFYRQNYVDTKGGAEPAGSVIGKKKI